MHAISLLPNVPLARYKKMYNKFENKKLIYSTPLKDFKSSNEQDISC